MPVSVLEGHMSNQTVCGWIYLAYDTCSGGLLGARKLSLGLHKKWGISPLEEKLPNFEDRSHNVGVVVVVVVEVA